VQYLTIGPLLRFAEGIEGDPAVRDYCARRRARAAPCVGELATNAVIHSHSAQSDGTTTVHADIRPVDRVRIEVRDDSPLCQYA
jgi:hypothetical protein